MSIYTVAADTITKHLMLHNGIGNTLTCNYQCEIQCDFFSCIGILYSCIKNKLFIDIGWAGQAVQWWLCRLIYIPESDV